MGTPATGIDSKSTGVHQIATSRPCCLLVSRAPGVRLVKGVKPRHPQVKARGLQGWRRARAWGLARHEPRARQPRSHARPGWRRWGSCACALRATFAGQSRVGDSAWRTHTWSFGVQLNMRIWTASAARRLGPLSSHSAQGQGEQMSLVSLSAIHCSSWCWAVTTQLPALPAWREARTCQPQRALARTAHAPLVLRRRPAADLRPAAPPHPSPLTLRLPH